MKKTVKIPEDLYYQIVDLVNKNEFATITEAVSSLIKTGLMYYDKDISSKIELIEDLKITINSLKSEVKDLLLTKKELQAKIKLFETVKYIRDMIKKIEDNVEDPEILDILYDIRRLLREILDRFLEISKKKRR